MKKTELFWDDKKFFSIMDWKKSLILIFFLIELGCIVWARFAPERYFCWAPHDCQTEYELTVFINGRELTADQIHERYHRHKKDRDVRSPDNVKGWIIQESLTYGRRDEISVTMQYTVNGIRQEPWIWHHAPQAE